MQSRFYAKPQGYYHHPVIKEKDQNMSVVIETRESSDKYHLPQIKQNNTSFTANKIHQAEEGQHQKFHDLSQQENNLSIPTQPDRPSATYYMKSRSLSPFIDKRLGPGHQKAYARVLEEQINSSKLKKVHERLSTIENERKLLADNSFYKHFEGGGENSAEKPNRRKTFRKDLEDLSVDYDPQHHLSKTDDGEKSLTAEQRFITIDSNEDNTSLSPNKYEKTEQTLDTIRATHQHNHNAHLSFQKQLEEEQKKTRTKSYLKKLEYKMALEQQIVEQKLKKKHEQEIKAIEGKFEAMRNSYTRLKAKAAAGPEHSSKITHEKPNRVPPIFVHGSSESVPHTEGNNTKSTTIRRPMSSRKLVPPQNIANSHSKASSRVSTRSKAAERRNQTIADDYHHPRLSLNYSSLQTKNYDLDEDSDPTNYSMIQNELNRIQNDIKGHMNRMDTKLTDIKHEIIFNQKQNREILQNREVLHRQLIQEHPNLVVTPFNIREPFSSQKQRLLPIEKMDAMASKQSLFNETQLVPLGTDLSATKITSASKNHYASTQTSHFSTRKENKTRSVDKPPRTEEYDSIVKNIVTYTKKLEQTISKQKQKINQDLGNIQKEIKQLKKKKDTGRESFFLTGAAEAMTNSTAKVSMENSPIRETPANESVAESINRISSLKARNHSKDIHHSQKGIRRTRDDFANDEKKEEQPSQNDI